MIRPLGQAAGLPYQVAMRSRALWIELLNEARLPYFESGSLLAAYREDEAAVAQEFSRRASKLGCECAWLSSQETLERTFALRPEGLLGALWSPTELTVDPRQVVGDLPTFLSARYGVRFHFNTPVQRVGRGILHTAEMRCEAPCIIVAGGDDFQTLFPACFSQSGLTRCKLQMMRTRPQPESWRLGPSLAFGLTFRHYPAFEVCASLAVLKQRVARETPEFDRFGIHVMVSQTAAGELTIGDSHEYGLEVDVFDKPAINRLIFDFARTYLRAPSLEIAQQWHGVYAKHPLHTWLCLTPVEGVRAVTFTSGIGMTMCLGVAEQTFCEMGVSL
jgi:FAD dependent oxidoreductase TIGR03364